MSRPVHNYLRHILDEIDYILHFSAGLAKEDFFREESLKRAFVRSIEIIGEAAKQISPDFKKRHKGIDWKILAGTRDILIHHYFGIDYEIVWDIVANEIPALKTQITDILKNSSDGTSP